MKWKQSTHVDVILRFFPGSALKEWDFVHCCRLEINELDHHAKPMEFFSVVFVALLSFSSAVPNDLRFYLNSIDKIKDQTENCRDLQLAIKCMQKKPSPLNSFKSINKNRLVDVFVINWQICIFYASFIAAILFGSFFGTKFNALRGWWT